MFPELVFSEYAVISAHRGEGRGWTNRKASLGVPGVLVILGRLLCLVCRWNPLPCGYIKGAHEPFVSGIPGLKSETWGTLRGFPVALVRKVDLCTG